MIAIRIDDSHLRQFLNRTIDRVSDMTPVMQRIAGAMHDAVEENFEQEGRPRWKPLAKATVLGRAKSGTRSPHTRVKINDASCQH